MNKDIEQIMRSDLKSNAKLIMIAYHIHGETISDVFKTEQEMADMACCSLRKLRTTLKELVDGGYLKYAA